MSDKEEPIEPVTPSAAEVAYVRAQFYSRTEAEVPNISTDKGLIRQLVLSNYIIGEQLASLRELIEKRGVDVNNHY